MPVESPNTLRSRARYKIVDIISEGPVKGLVNGAQSIYLDNTVVQNRDGSYNFPNFSPSRDIKELPIAAYGATMPIYPGSFPASENTVNVGVKITKDNPEGEGIGDGSATRTITDASLDSVRVTVRVPALTTTNTATGDITGGKIRFNIFVKPDGGSFAAASSGSQWESLATPDAETDDGATGIEATATYAGGALPTGAHCTWQYRKKTGGVWGDWQSYAFVSIPSTSPSSDNRGYYNQWSGAQTFTRSITGLPPGIYQTQVVTTPKGVNATSARQFIENVIEIEGKTVAPYDASYLITLPEGGAPWDVRVVRVSDDNTGSQYQDDLYWLSYTEIINNRFSWPNVAGMQIAFDAESFGGNIPARSYDYMGLMIEIPSNYDPYDRTYTGVWDGTFKTEWTDNPAWIFYALLTNKRWGLGNSIPAAQVDKWGLYTIAQYCDELVDAPSGEQEPRYTCSTVINSQQEAYELLTAIASAFRGMIYWSNGAITATADMPTDTLINVGPANVIDGEFTYQGASRKSRHSVARVSWNNPDDGYKLNVEIYEDTEAIRKYGYRPIDINAIGCTSRGLARRWAKWQITSDNDAPDTVTYKASFDHFMTQGKAVRPGDVVAIADPNYSAEQNFGRIVSVVDNEDTTHTITLDREVTLIGGDDSELQLTITDGSALALDVSVVSTVTSEEITVASASLTTIPLAGATWLLKKETVEPRLWRVFSVTEPEPNIYQVSAMLYSPTKYDSIETGLNFEEAAFSAMPTGEMPAPTGVLHSEFLKQTGSAIIACVNLSWTRPDDARADLFEVQYQLDGEDWRATEPNLTNFTGIDIINIVPGTYNFRVRAQDTTGLFRSAWTTYASKVIRGKNKPPEDVTGFSAIIEKYGVLMNWTPVSDIDINYYEIRMGGNGWDDADFVGRTAGTTYKYEDQTTATLTFRIKARDTNDNWAINATSTTSTGETQNVPTVTTMSIPIGIQVDIAGDLKRGFSHWELRRRVYSTQVASAMNERITTRVYFDEAYDDLVFGEAYEYSARAVDVNNVASEWSAYSSPVFPLQIQSNDITADQIVAKDFRTAQDVGVTVDGVKFTADGIEMWEEGVRKVFIPVTGDPEFTGLLTAGAGHIGGWEIFSTYLQSSNIKLDSAGLLQTLDFVSGHKGWKINQDGNAEFNNLRARGAIKTVVFEKDEISVVGGRTLIRPAGVVKDYNYTDFINAASSVYFEECWDKLNTLLDESNVYVAPTFANYAEYLATEAAYYDELSVAMGFNQFACAIEEADYDDATKDAYLTACWAQLMTLLDLSTVTPAIPSMTFAVFVSTENGYFDKIAEAIDNPPLFEPYLSENETAIETENADQFKVGDIIRVKDGLANDYWGRISAISGDMLSITGESGEPFAITAGQTIVNYGIPGSGGILLDGQAPLMDVYTHSGEPWNGTDIRLRIGNLNGWGAINDDIYGIAIGNPTGEYLVYDSTSGRLRLNGAIQITEGAGIGNFSDAGALATADNLDDVTDGATYKRTTANEKTGAGRAYSGLDSSNRLVTAVIPATAVTPAGAGLFLGSNYLGFYNSGWKTYMDNAGNFALVGSGAHGLSWNAGTGVLTIAGSITVVGGSGYANFTDKPTDLAGINSTEGDKLAGIDEGADVTANNTAYDTTRVAGVTAATVRDNAANALDNAATANNLLANIAADNKFTPVEKQSARKEWDIIAAERAGINSQATAFGITTENTTYNNAFQALATYLNNGTTWSSGIPSWLADANLATTTTIVGATFRTNWKTYYDARTALLNAIAAKAKTLADTAQGVADGAASAASAAQGTANAAIANAATANGKAGNLAITGLGVKVNYAGFTASNYGELYLHGYSDSTGAAADVDGWVMWNGEKVTVSKGMINPNAICPYNVPLFVVQRSGTKYIVWFETDSMSWEYSAAEAASVLGTWTWATATDIVLLTFTSPSSEGAIVGAQLFTPPKTNKDVVAALDAAIFAWAVNNDLTYINGAKLYTGTVFAEALNVEALKAPAGAVGSWNAKGATNASIVIANGVKDTSGNNNHATATAGVTVGRDAVKDSYFLMNSGAERLTIATPVTAGVVTCSIWVYRHAAASTSYKALFCHASSDRDHVMLNPAWVLCVFDGTVRASTYTLPNDSQWHQITVVLTSATSAAIYVDGAYHSTIATTLNLTTYPVGCIGGHPTQPYYAGYISDPCVWNRALTAAEIKTLYMLGTDRESGTITADRVVTGQIKSLNYSTTAGSMIDLDDGTFKFGGSSDPALGWDGSSLTVKGTVYANDGTIGGFDIYSNKLETNLTQDSDNIHAIGLHSPIDQTTVKGLYMFRKNSGAPYSDVRLTTSAGVAYTSAALYLAMVDNEHYAIYCHGIIKGYLSDSSDERTKTDITSTSVLDRLAKLTISEWQYDDEKTRSVLFTKNVEETLKKQNIFPIALAPEIRDLPQYKNINRHIGPMAKQFNELFQLNGLSEEDIKPSDIASVALRAIQELAEIVDEQKAEIAELRAALNLPEKKAKAIEITDEEIAQTLDKHLAPAAAEMIKELKRIK